MAEQIFSSSLHDVFIAAVPMAVLAFVIALFLKEIPLATRSTPGESVNDSVEADATVVAH